MLVRIAAVLLAMGAGLAQAQTIPDSDPRPNIVLVFVDDLDTASMASLPGLRSLTTEAGLSFTRGYVPNSVCGPSRGALLTGTYNHTNRLIFNNRGHYRRWRDGGWEDRSLPVALQAAGYETIHIGKPVNGWPGENMPAAYTPPGWDSYTATVLGDGQYEDFDLYVGEPRPPGSPPQFGRLVSYRGEEAYRTDVEMEFAVDRILHRRAEIKPFFLYLSLFAPHAESGLDEPAAIPAPRHRGAFEGATVPRDPDFDEADVSDKHERIREARLLPDPGAIDRLHATRLESMLAVEDAMRTLNAALEAAGVADNTYVFFVSDNGLMMGHHRIRASKGFPYERSARVPFSVSGPGIAPGRTDDRLVSIVDLAPTFLDLAGQPVPDHYEGRSLAPLLTGGNAPRRSSLLLEGWSRESDPYYRTIVTDAGLKYSEFPTSGETETYDLAVDPFEVDDATAALSAPQRSGLSARLARLAECRGRDCVEVDGLPIPPIAGVAAEAGPLTTAFPVDVRWRTLGLSGPVRVALRAEDGTETPLGQAEAAAGGLTTEIPESWRGRTARLVVAGDGAEWVGEPTAVVDGRPIRSYDGAAGVHVLGPPAAGMTVADLAALNLVRGVPGLFPDDNPTLWTVYDNTDGWQTPASPADTLALGLAFRWQLFDRDDIGVPGVSVSRPFPFELRADARPNMADVPVVLDTDSPRWNFLANPFNAPLDLSRIAEWPGGNQLASAAAVFDAQTLAWVDAPVAEPWQAFRVRARGEQAEGLERVLTIPAWAAGFGEAPPAPSRSAVAPVSAEAPSDVALDAPVPNPSSGGAAVRFALAERGPARLAVYDVRGRTVAVLADGVLAAGAHRARLPDGLAGGVYVVRLEAGGRVLTQRAAVAR